MTIKRKIYSAAIYGVVAIFVVFLAPFALLAVVAALIGSVGVVRGISALSQYRRTEHLDGSKRYAIAAGICVIGIPALLGLAIWDVDGMHVDNPIGCSSPSVVSDYTGVNPPASARNIRTADWHKGMMFDEFVRFEAPPDVCLAYAKRVAKGRPLVPVDSPPSDPSVLGSRYIPNLRWFDLSQATKIVGTEEEPSVWVDQSRGVFYFYEGF